MREGESRRDGRRLRARVLTLVLAGIAVAACGAPGAAAPGGSESAPPEASGSAVVSPAPSGADGRELAERLAEIHRAVGRWQAARLLVEARAAAEEARNLVVGPDGPGYGDADGDGTIRGASGIGLLPGSAGQPGLATAAAGPCVERDVLGGSWADPARRWAILAEAIAAWSPSNNTFPSLPSHPQRVVGWATLALASTELATALEYGGHAGLHSGLSLRAVTACAG